MCETFIAALWIYSKIVREVMFIEFRKTMPIQRPDIVFAFCRLKLFLYCSNVFNARAILSLIKKRYFVPKLSQIV